MVTRGDRQGDDLYSHPQETNWWIRLKYALRTWSGFKEDFWGKGRIMPRGLLIYSYIRHRWKILKGWGTDSRCRFREILVAFPAASTHSRQGLEWSGAANPNKGNDGTEGVNGRMKLTEWQGRKEGGGHRGRAKLPRVLGVQSGAKNQRSE